MAMLKSVRGERIADGVASLDISERGAFIAKVYNYLFGAVALMVITGFVAFKQVPVQSITRELSIGLAVAGLVVFIAGMFSSRVKGLNLVLFGIYAIIDGVLLGCLARLYINAGLGSIFAQAAVLSLLVFGGLTAFVHITKKDFSFLGGFLFVMVLLLIGAVIVGFFIKSTLLHLGIAVGGTAIFAMYILFDTSQVIHRLHEDEAVTGAWMLFIDLIGLFIYLLDLLTILSGRD
ncbi:Bax inhibitor-1 family protein [Myxococcota bacterium]|nr:Bax inhibitor-1 family protein [Myxococcota bacterium]